MSGTHACEMAVIIKSDGLEETSNAEQQIPAFYSNRLLRRVQRNTISSTLCDANITDSLPFFKTLP